MSLAVPKPSNEMKFRLSQGQALVGTFVTIPHPMAVEISADMGFDFLVVECEHSTTGRSDLASLIRAGDAFGSPVLVRVPSSNQDWIAAALDGGAAGVIVPHVETRQQALQIAEAARFPPVGGRGVGACRANGYGAGLTEYIGSANNRILVNLMIETRLGLANLEEIAAVDGIDVILVGPADMALSLGLFGAEGGIAIAEANRKVRETCARHGKFSGIIHTDPRKAPSAIDEGFRLHFVSADFAFMLSAGREAATLVKRMPAS